MTTRSARRPLALMAACLALTACAPSVDQSGWEMARKRSTALRPDAFPEIPIVLPGSPTATAAAQATGSPMEGVARKRLDEGSLFRRGYGAPTP